MPRSTESEIIRLLGSRFQAPEGVTGIGDDAAIIPGENPSSPDLTITTDLLAEGVHFLREGISPEALGWKSAAVNISDIAAMGAVPRWAFLSLALPRDTVSLAPLPDDSWPALFIQGFSRACKRFGVTLLGGDTSASEGGVFINVTLIGECPKGTALRRSSARPGDLICVTGTLGDSSAGLKLILERLASGTQSESGSAEADGANAGGGRTEADGASAGGGIEADRAIQGEGRIAGDGAIAGDGTFLYHGRIAGDGAIAGGAEAIANGTFFGGGNTAADGAIPGYGRIAADGTIPGDGAHAGGGTFLCRGKTEADGGTSCNEASWSGNVPRAETDEAYLLKRHCRPEPRVDEGIALRLSPGVHAMMDLSDGLAADLPRILEASGVGASVDVRTLPFSPELRRTCAARGWDPVHLALCGGEDYELLFTMAPGSTPPVPHTVIGRIEGEPGLRWQGSPCSFKGFSHF